MARPEKGRGLFYTRDSGGKHEMTPAAYLRWANKRAEELGVDFRVADDTITRMVENRQAVCGDVYLDYDVCGNLLSRPALDALKARIDTDKSVTHLFIPRRDRLSRPDEPTEGLVLETSLRRSGMTIVFMSNVLGPLARGERVDIGEIVTGVVDYDKAGKDRRDLAEKIISAHLSLARAGYSTGGRPCYGFRRWLVRVDGTKVRQLQDGERVRMAGHHVVWLPVPDDHPEMIVIRRIRELLKTTPASRVARMLTEEGIPSPDAGRKRIDQGIEHLVSGDWHQPTVTNIGRNALLAAVCSYGQRSMGDQLRFAPDGPRLLTDDDYRADGKAKVIRNAPESIQRSEASFEPIFPHSEHEELQAVLDVRGTSQRGKPRSRDPNNNPLGSRVFDLHCGWPMYRAPYSGSFRYGCGLYTQSHGAKCGHHHIDGPTAIRLVMNCIVQKVLTPGGMTKLRERLEALAAAEAAQPVADPSVELRQKLLQLQTEQEKIERNLALSETPEERKAVAKIFNKNLSEIAELEQQLSQTQVAVRLLDRQTELNSALAVLNRLPELLSQQENMAAVTAAFHLVNARMYLGFTKQKKTKRTVNKVSRGLLTFGNTPPPIPLYTGPTGRRALQANMAVALTASPAGGVPLPDRMVTGREGNSLGNVSRGDTI